MLVIGGPTAVGKSEIACCVAKEIGGEIISADSMAVYRYMDIGTAKLKECMREVKHYLVDVVDPDRYFDVKMFEKMAYEAYQEIVNKGKVPMLVGGTYLYIQVFLYGLAETPEPDWKLRNRLYEVAKRRGPEFLWQKLLAIDPVYARKIHPKDARRIVRALEVFINSGRPFSSFHEWRGPRFRYVGFYIKRSWESLKSRIENRLLDMVRKGLIEEIKELWEREMSMTTLQAIGYKEFIPYLKGERGLEESIKEAVKNTCDQAKRQIRWFRRQGWHEVDLDIMDIKEACKKVVDIYAETEEYQKKGIYS